MMTIPAPFLFHPDRIAARLTGLPALAAELKPAREGAASASFAGWRASARQIYKPLANIEGTHGFDDLLERVDHWLARGFGAKALRARDRASFRGSLAELGVADHFEARGFEVSGLDAAKADAQTADMGVELVDVKATVEVYSPVEWEGLEYFELDSWDTLRQLDLPYDYLFHFDVAKLQLVGPDVAYRQLHPEDLSRGLDTAAKRQRVLQPLFDAVVDELERGVGHVVVEQTDDELNISLRVELEHVRPLTDFEPRAGTHGGPGTGGYRPELIFRDVLDRALAKAARGQARTGAESLAVVIVDVSRLPLQSEFDHTSYQAMFREITDELLPSDAKLPVDVFALCRSRGWRSELHTYYAAWETDRVSRVECESLLGPLG